MEIFGVGPLELLLVLVLALVILGPEDMVGTSRKIGQWIYKIVRSPTWRAILSTTQDLRELPQKIVRDAGIEDAIKEVKDTVNDAKSQVSDATREVNAEMQAATREVNSEMQDATQQVNQGMQPPGSNAANNPYSIPYYGGSNQVWPEQTLAGYTPPTTASYDPPTAAGYSQPTATGYTPASNKHYETLLEQFALSLASGPCSAADLDGIVPAPVPPPPPLATPELIAGALGFTAPGAAPADLEVPFVFADPTDYPDPQPAVAVAQAGAAPEPTAEHAPALAAEPVLEIPQAGEAPDAAAPVAASEPPPAPAENGVLPSFTEETLNTGVTEAMEERMRRMDEAFERLDAKIARDAELAQDPPPPTGAEPASET